MCEGHVQEAWNMWRRKPDFDVCSGAGSGCGGRAHLVVAKLHAAAVPGMCSHSAECILPVVVSAAAAATKLLAGHGMIDIAALHALTTGASRGWDAEVGACGSQAEVTTANIQRQTGGGRGTPGLCRGWGSCSTAAFRL